MLRTLANLALRKLSLSKMEERIRRLENNPIITESMLPTGDGDNINGPSLVRVPDWVEAPLGKYYLYFAHHRGAYIRMAYADQISGPWKILAGGVLSCADVPAVRDHIASPDVIVDHVTRRFRMYFHGPLAGQKSQHTFVALSPTGIHYEAHDTVLGPFYFRVFEHEGAWYAISKGGVLHRSGCGLTPFAIGHNCDPQARTEKTGKYNQRGSIRHVAVRKLNARLAVYFTRIGDRPERIFRAWIDLGLPWTAWVMGRAEEIVRPRMAYEGAELPLRRSKSGQAIEAENALRDPAIFIDTDGHGYLLYSAMGEKAIVIAQVTG